MKKYLQNWSSDNIEELFKPGTILAMVAAGDSVIDNDDSKGLPYDVPGKTSLYYSRLKTSGSFLTTSVAPVC